MLGWPNIYIEGNDDEHDVKPKSNVLCLLKPNLQISMTNIGFTFFHFPFFSRAGGEHRNQPIDCVTHSKSL